MTKIESMGKFTAIGMRTKVEDPAALVIGTCGKNDTSERGTPTNWVWSNPTNRAILHHYEGYTAVSVEACWQGIKILEPGGRPNVAALDGNWRLGKAKRPIGAWAGEGKPSISNVGQARRMIYIPAFKNLISYWEQDEQVRWFIESARNHPGPVYLRDHDIGRGVNRNGPMSHSWVLCEYLNTGKFPD